MAENGKDPRLQKFRAEVQLVVDTYPDFAIWPPDWREIGDFEYAYRKGQVLVADRDLDRTVRLLDGVEVVDRLPVGVNVLQGRDDDIQRLLEVGDAELGRGVVTPNHILEVCPRAGMCPATEPVVPASADPWPAVASVNEGKGVRVAVVDTGFLQARYDKPWLAGVIADPSDIEDPDSWPAPDGFIDPYAGHGTFIAGVIRCIGPRSASSRSSIKPELSARPISSASSTTPWQRART